MDEETKTHIVIGGICLLLLIYGALAFRKLAYEVGSSKWPSVTAVVTRSQAGAVAHGAHGGEHYPHLFSYHYEVEGRSYDGRLKTLLDDEWNSEKTLGRLLKEYPVGKRITVYYDPRRPWTAVVYPGAGRDGPFRFWSCIVLMSLTFPGSAWFFWRAWRLRNYVSLDC
jgi:hypothetical protein